MSSRAPLKRLLEVMAKLRSPEGCPWDREQDHGTLRFHAVEEAYELMDAIESGDDGEMAEELGDLLLQVVFHTQLAKERRAFDFDAVCRRITEKLIRRHPHVFGNSNAKTVDAVWEQWEKIKKAEKAGTKHDRSSALDGIPRHLPALLRAEKLSKKARKAGLLRESEGAARLAGMKSLMNAGKRIKRSEIGAALFDLASASQAQGWSAEELLRSETQRREKRWRVVERNRIKPLDPELGSSRGYDPQNGS